MADKWDGKERRRYTDSPEVKDSLSSMSLAIESLSNRFDNALGSPIHPGMEGTVNTKLKEIILSLDAMRGRYDLILLGDGHENSGLAGFKKEFRDHVNSDIRAFGVIVTILVGIFTKVVFFN